MNHKPTREELAQRLIDRMRDFTNKLKSGVPIECTNVTRIETPDGPAHIRAFGIVEARNG